MVLPYLKGLMVINEIFHIVLVYLLWCFCIRYWVLNMFLVHDGIMFVFQSTSMQDPIYAQLIQLSRNQMIIDTLGHQLTTLRWIISGGSLESDDKFCDFIQLMIDDFDPKELCIGEFIIEARRRFPSLNL
jgi:hypothetical protein